MGLARFTWCTLTNLTSPNSLTAQFLLLKGQWASKLTSDLLTWWWRVYESSPTQQSQTCSLFSFSTYRNSLPDFYIYSKVLSVLSPSHIYAVSMRTCPKPIGCCCCGWNAGAIFCCLFRRGVVWWCCRPGMPRPLEWHEDSKTVGGSQRKTAFMGQNNVTLSTLQNTAPDRKDATINWIQVNPQRW